MVRSIANQQLISLQKYDAKTDSTLSSIQKIPAKYFSQVDKKIDKYSNRITSKTEKTLVKLNRWENKIHTLLLKASPETANRLFAPGRETFSTMLQKIQRGESVMKQYRGEYNEYEDKLTTGIKCIQSQKEKLDSNYIKKAQTTSKKLTQLEADEANTQATQQFIKQRKKQLFEESLKYIGKSRYLSKINKESYYYVETIKNYKEIFSDEKKTEETVTTILMKIPAFQKYMNENGALGSLFGGLNGSGTAQSIAGLQTRAQIQGMLQDKIAAGGPNARSMISDNMQHANNEIAKLKDKVRGIGGNSSNADVPDFKPNRQKTKTFFQRLEYGSNIQFIKNTSLIPTTADIALSIAYKLNDKSQAGIGGAYKMGIGSIEHLAITHQGIGLRIFGDWKLKKQFFLTGGFEMNHLVAFRNFEAIQHYQDWQQSGLIGVSKKYKVGKKLKGESKVLFDFLYRQHIPVSQPIIFRIGYLF